MNTAARMESTGAPGKIQISQDTADLLVAAGKSHWLTAREDVVYAKGKGEMSTFWLNPGNKSSNRDADSVRYSNMSSCSVSTSDASDERH